MEKLCREKIIFQSQVKPRKDDEMRIIYQKGWSLGENKNKNVNS